MRKIAMMMIFLCGTVAAQFNQDSLKHWMKNGPSFDFILIDLRGPGDNITQVIANDLCKPYNLVWPDEFKASIPKIQKDMHVVVYCKSGGRSSQAYSYLVSEGYTNVHDAGGFMYWDDTVRAFSENAIMPDSLLPAPSMVPFAAVKYAWFKPKTESHARVLFVNSGAENSYRLSLNGRITCDKSAAKGIFVENAYLKLAAYRK